MRYMAVDNKYGIQYLTPFKRFAIASWQEALTFAPASTKGRDRIKKLRSDIGLSPWPEVSEKAREEYLALFEVTGARASIEAITEEDEAPLNLSYMEGRVCLANKKSR
jgi:hypothetical protein